MKKMYFKNWVEETISCVSFLIIGFVGCTIENLGNATYNKILVVALIVLVVNGLLLSKYGKGANLIDIEEEE